MARSHHRTMQSRYVNGITIRPLRDGDTETVAALFERLGDGSREKRFCGGKPRLSDAELASLARVDADHHVSSATSPATGSRPESRGSPASNGAAEVAFEVADEYQGRGVGSTLVRAWPPTPARSGSSSSWPRSPVTIRVASLLGRSTRRLRRMGRRRVPGRRRARIDAAVSPRDMEHSRPAFSGCKELGGHS